MCNFQGFMVTKKEYESCSESDNEAPEEKKVEVKAKPEVKAEPKAKKATKKTMAPPGKQQSIMNFFKKK